ncbi:MAG: bifunctional phosphoribosylaminoimidazolecarboxamide formyltransferase/IMP cyclohydrolase [bacterium]|nr:bifunctional phosphoribosylaminoimidazolecarboxamide formyltransferase/IMP cyclohydrolase [bacterium]
MTQRIQRALLSVSDKTGIEEFAAGLASLDIELLSTGGTYKRLVAAGVPVAEVADHTGFPEMMDGRVKTLHPKIHGGILALREEASHVGAMCEHGIAGIDLVVVNLYPFEETVANADVKRAEAIEQIDIGGPSMVRSAAKNHRYVGIVTRPADYDRVLAELKSGDVWLSDAMRADLAQKAFSLTARYDAAISEWLFQNDRTDQVYADGGDTSRFPFGFALAGVKEFDLRYGENPHQEAAFYTSGSPAEPCVATAKVLNGKALSYNNLVDLDAALAVAKEFADPFVAVLKHTNPCGAALADKVQDALERAWSGDPISAFGSVLSFTRPVNLACAKFLVDGNRFVEAIIAPGFDEDAFELLTKKPKWGKSVRLLDCGPFSGADRDARDVEVKKLVGGFLLQERDLKAEDPADFETVTKSTPSKKQLAELAFAGRIAKHVKSNAIVLTGDRTIYGVGAGQMSRVDSVRIAVSKAGERAKGSVLASDAFFPFPDGVETAIEAGITAILEPGGSVRDDEVIGACDKARVPMVFSGARHFRH